jgi:hypothetical protein
MRKVQRTKAAFSGFGDEIVLTLELPRGNYIVQARLFVGNIDGDAQNSSCGLRLRRSLQFIDRLDFRLGGRNADIMMLQAMLRLKEEDVVDLTAGTFNGFTQYPRMYALPVDGFFPPL